MSSLLSYLPWPFSNTPVRQPPAQIPTDEILPVHLFDDTKVLRPCILVWLFRFDEILDAEMLNASLCSVFEREGWRKLGGRYRRRTDGKLEIRVPQQFTGERPPVSFTKESFNLRIDQHPMASKLPVSGDGPRIFDGPRAFNDLAMGPDSPTSFDDLIFDDRPQFFLHVSTFMDGTLVGVSHSHMTADLLGFAAVIEAWSYELAGKPDQIAPLGGVLEDGMKGLYEPPTEREHLLAGTELAGWRLAYWGLSALLESKREPLKSKTLCIPNKTMSRLLDRATGEIADGFCRGGQPKQRSENPSFISHGDVLAALVCRIRARSLPKGSTRNVTTMIALDPRTRAPSAFRASHRYAGNSPTAVFWSCAANEAVDMALGSLALRARECITLQATEEQMKAYSVLCAESVLSTNMNVMFGDKDMAFQLMSNWLKASLFQKMDFHPAIVQEAASWKPEGTRGHPTYYHSADPGNVDGPYMVQLVVVMGADAQGNIWMSCVLPDNSWKLLLDYLEECS